jgi:ComF family protein
MHGRWRRGSAALWQVIFPQRCFACAEASGNGVLCAACLAALPGRERPRCPVCALPEATGSVCGRCVVQAPPFEASIAAVDYAFPVDRLVQALKYQHRLSMTRLFVELMAALPPPQADLVLPLPLHRRRLIARGFNQAAELARPLGRRWGIPVLLDAVERDVDTRPQALLPWQARTSNMRGAFRVTRPLGGLSIVVIDDVMTTGATLGEFARALKGAGARRVENRVLARTPR